MSKMKKYRIYTVEDEGTENSTVIELPDDIFEEVREVSDDAGLDNTSFYIEEVEEKNNN